MRIFKTKWFAQFARQEKVEDSSLREAIARAKRGLIDADLGGGLIKLRVARKGKGRSGGYRMIVAYRVRDLAVFFYGFAKSELENIAPRQLLAAREIAAEWLAANAERLARAVSTNELEEITDEETSKPANGSPS